MQRQEFENYLARTDVSIEEKSKAIDELIEPGTFVSENLLTTVEEKITPEQRAATLAKVTSEWTATKRFPDLQNAIAELHARAAESFTAARLSSRAKSRDLPECQRRPF